jgi:hypothetical protein
MRPISPVLDASLPTSSTRLCMPSQLNGRGPTLQQPWVQEWRGLL